MALTFAENTFEYQVHETLRSVIDPELNINIVDLGLVYEINANQNEKALVINMSLSSPGCPLGDVILTDVTYTLKRKFTEWEVKVNLVWEPTWTPDMVTDAGREALNL